MSEAVIECVPNFSEGSDRAKVCAIIDAMRVERVSLLDWSMDSDHNRSVVTIAGPPEAVVQAAVRGAGKAAELIDLTTQQGVHPRIGAADVIPFVPVAGISLEQCVLFARQAGWEIWKQNGIPIYFYGAAAARPDRAELEDVRRGQFEGLRSWFRVKPAAGRTSGALSCMQPPEQALWPPVSFLLPIIYISINRMLLQPVLLPGRFAPPPAAWKG